MADLGWDEVAERFAAARNWWVATAGPSGPHAVPVWGVAVEGALCFYGDAGSVRSRNLAADPRVVLHLESGEQVLIVHGVARGLGPSSGAPEVVAAYRAKYTDPGDQGYLPDDPEMGDPAIVAVTAQRAMAWDLTSFFDSQRRWRSAD